jgi:hypothetical protein
LEELARFGYLDDQGTRDILSAADRLRALVERVRELERTDA